MLFNLLINCYVLKAKFKKMKLKLKHKYDRPANTVIVGKVGNVVIFVLLHKEG